MLGHDNDQVCKTQNTRSLIVKARLILTHSHELSWSMFLTGHLQIHNYAQKWAMGQWDTSIY